ncbi:MAG: FGGY-family carbohydrate kinase, partial [Clostridia bacterium]
VGVPVVAGGLDAACGTLGAGVIKAGQTQEQGGQAGGMSICLDSYKADIRLIMGTHVVPDLWLLQGGTVGGGGAVNWFEREFCHKERDIAKTEGGNSFYHMDKGAEIIGAGSDGMVFLPYLAGERSPIWDTNAKGVFYGIDFSKTKDHFARAVMEGVAFSLRHNLEIAETAGAKVEVLCAMGGAANSRLWTQIKADVTGKTITVPSSDTATALGAAILAGVGTGMYDSFEEAVDLTVKTKREHNPNEENAENYNKAYEIYLELYNDLKETMKK